ncbi:hypothetical protein QUB10_26315 [Microcoleus sp. B5-D4]|uniref:hypothetical protein n=1 Tax=unclassified Microcoleus TaxID=2642155 RepID=UPI002FCEE36A
MPNPYSPQENLLFVEQASCLFLRMVQDVSVRRSHLSPPVSRLSPACLPLREKSLRVALSPVTIPAQGSIACNHCCKIILAIF